MKTNKVLEEKVTKNKRKILFPFFFLFTKNWVKLCNCYQSGYLHIISQQIMIISFLFWFIFFIILIFPAISIAKQTKLFVLLWILFLFLLCITFFIQNWIDWIFFKKKLIELHKKEQKFYFLLIRLLAFWFFY